MADEEKKEKKAPAKPVKAKETAAKAPSKAAAKPVKAESEAAAKPAKSKTEPKPAKKETVKRAVKTPAAIKDRGNRKVRVGQVISDKMDKTLVVTVVGSYRHRLYKKTMKKTKKFVVHDELNQAGIGDLVEIMETRPLSKLKRWRLIGVVEKAK